MSGMKVLPRYRPTSSGVGCAVHNDPTCLCDVVLGEQVPILRTEHKFHKLALHELGDDTVSERNLYEFFSIVLGLHKLERSFMTTHQKVLKRDAFMMLPKDVRDAVQNHAKADSPKHIMLMELEGLGLTADQTRDVCAAYAQLTGQLRARDRREGDRPIVERDETPDQRKQRRHMERMKSDPEYAAKRAKVAAESYQRRRERRARANGKGKSWIEAKHTGPTLVPGTYALEDDNG